MSLFTEQTLPVSKPIFILDTGAVHVVIFDSSRPPSSFVIQVILQVNHPSRIMLCLVLLHDIQAMPDPSEPVGP